MVVIVMASDAQIIPCDNCAAPLPIDLEVEALTCEHCDHTHVVSAQERKAMRRMVKEIRRTDAVSNAAAAARYRLLRSVLAQLFLTGVWQTLGLVLLIALGWAFGFMASGLLTVPGIYERGNGFLLGTLPQPTFCVLLTLLVVTLYRARQVRDLRAAAAARPPLAPDRPLRCRVCGSDLKQSCGANDAARAYVRCDYCKTENLIGLAHVQRREQLTRAKAKDRLERLRTAEKRVSGALGWAAAAFVLAPPALGLCMMPIHGTFFTMIAPLLEPPPEPGPWTKLHSRLALLRAEKPGEPWPVVYVLDPQPAPRVRVLHGKARLSVEAAKLRQLPLRPGLRVADPKDPARGVGILSDEFELRFPGSMRDYGDAEPLTRGWHTMAVAPNWGAGAWQPAAPKGAKLVLIKIALPALSKGVVWVKRVDAFSSQLGRSAASAVGPPEARRLAWLPARRPDTGPATLDWITVGYGAETVRASSVVVVELCEKQSRLVRVDDFSDFSQAVPLWRGSGSDLPGKVKAPICIWRLDLPEPREIRALRVMVAGGGSPIDAVGVIPAPRSAR
jgi:hypothetical protein